MQQSSSPRLSLNLTLPSTNEDGGKVLTEEDDLGSNSSKEEALWETHIENSEENDEVIMQLQENHDEKLDSSERKRINFGRSSQSPKVKETSSVSNVRREESQQWQP